MTLAEERQEDGSAVFMRSSVVDGDVKFTIDFPSPPIVVTADSSPLSVETLLSATLIGDGPTSRIAVSYTHLTLPTIYPV